MPDLAYGEAANAALHRALDEWPQALLYGEDVAIPGGVFGVTRGLRKAFGDRVFDTPISESTILGSALGAAMMGRRPIVEVMWIDFALVALDQLVNQAANTRYVSQGRLSAPLTVRTQQGSQPGACAQHSQSLEAFFGHVPGLRVAMPSTPQDAYDLLLAGHACDDPTIVIENRNLYFGQKQAVTVDGPIQEVGGAAIRHPGSDVTIVTWGATALQAAGAADRLAHEAISAEVIDVRWISPFDTDAVIRSVSRTRRLVVAHEANLTGGFGAEVVARVAESGVQLDAPPVRVGLPDTRVPAAPSLLAALAPNTKSIEAAVRRCVGDGRSA